MIILHVSDNPNHFVAFRPEPNLRVRKILRSSLIGSMEKRALTSLNYKDLEVN